MGVRRLVAPADVLALVRLWTILQAPLKDRVVGRGARGRGARWGQRSRGRGSVWAAGRFLLWAPCGTDVPARDEREEGATMMNRLSDESGRIGYLVLYMMGVPIGLLLLLWVILGNNIFSAG